MDRAFETLGIVEFSDWIYVRDTLRPDRNENESEVHSCLKAHLDAGLTHVAFSVGRSVVEYQSKSPLITRHMGKADLDLVRPCDIDLLREMEKECVLTSAVDFAHANGMTVYAHLCMNRHYGSQHYGGALTSELARREDMQEVHKNGTKDTSRLCFALQDYRDERLAIVSEAAEIGVDGVLLDFVRQPPMLRYHPALTSPYKSRTGRNPEEINVETEPEVFLDWCADRAGVLTSFMRTARRRLKQAELDADRRIPLIARITDDGFTANMIAGIDVETWCREHIVDCVVTHPLQWIHGIWTHDVRPYVDLGRRTGVTVYGGVNTYPVHKGFQFNPVSIAERIRQQYDAGVAGVALYETNDTVLHAELEPILRAIGSDDGISELLNDREWRKAWPVNGLNENCGMDNHSGSPREVLLEL